MKIMNISTIKRLHSRRLELLVCTIITGLTLVALPVDAITTATSTTSTATQAKLQTIINVGNGEITRRLTTLNNLTTGINAAKYLTSSDKSSLLSELMTESGDLTSLQTKLDSETTVTAATTDDVSVITEYRVYVLVVPKVYIIISADDQQAAEAVLTTTANNFQSAITAAKNNGKDVTSLESELTALNSEISAAQAISSNMESSVIGLQPTDYNTDHSLLTGDYTKLQTAQSDNLASVNDANQMLTNLQDLE